MTLQQALAAARARLEAADLPSRDAAVDVDLFARTIVVPAELPIGIVTSFLGGPFFLWLLLRQKGAF